MIYKTIIYFNLYILCIPFLISWFVFIFLNLKIIFQKVFGIYAVYYYPETSSSLIYNMIFVLPQRNTFNLIYFFKKEKLFNPSYAWEMFKYVGLILLIGMPLSWIFFIFYTIKYKNIDAAWDRLSSFRKAKIIIIDGKIIRNGHSKIAVHTAKEILNKTLCESNGFFNQTAKELIIMKEKLNGNIIRGGMVSKILKTGNSKITEANYTHAVGFLQQSKLGIICTSKEQFDVSPISKVDCKQINPGIITNFYIQRFNKFDLIPCQELESKNLIELCNAIEIPVLKASVCISTNNNVDIKSNIDDKQIVITENKTKDLDIICDICNINKKDAILFYTNSEITELYTHTVVMAQFTYIEILKITNKFDQIRVINNSRIIENLESLKKIESLKNPEIEIIEQMIQKINNLIDIF